MKARKADDLDRDLIQEELPLGADARQPKERIVSRRGIVFAKPHPSGVVAQNPRKMSDNGGCGESVIDNAGAAAVRGEAAPTFAITVREGEFSVDLRELHQALESKQEFSNWAKSKLSQFSEGEDFASFDNVIKREKGASVRKDYSVTLDCAKHIAMMEQTERGRQFRCYFIECEKALRERSLPEPAPRIPQTLPEALRLAADLAEKKAFPASIG
jgi:phage anti-repressor protein